MESPALFGQIHPLFKDKTVAQTEKSRGKTKGREENKPPGGKHSHHSPWWCPLAVLALHCKSCLGSSVLGLLGFFCKLS